MTTIGTGAAITLVRRQAWVAMACLASLGLGACETSSNVFGTNGPAASAAIGPAPAAQAAPQMLTKIAIGPIFGPPEAVSKSLTAQLAETAERQRIGIVRTPGEPANYTVRGYFALPAKDRGGSKLSYYWEVRDQAGKQVNRITGEETLAPVAGGPATGGDAWAAITPQLMQSISDKTVASLATWLPTQAAQPLAQPAVAQVGTSSATTASLPAGAATTGSIATAIQATAPKVSGAPGDGNTSLAAAMRRELEEKGIQVAETGQAVYRVAGDVKIKPAKEGTQAISINWTVSDPKGVEVAKITQNNDVPVGLLDKAWGASAEDAAKAASVQIRQVIADHRAGRQIQSSVGPTAARQVN